MDVSPAKLTRRVFAFAIVSACAAEAAARSAVGPVRSRVAVLVDSSSAMLLTPRILTFSETCADWNPCTFAGNPTAAQEACNACVRDTIRFRATCASNWTSTCRSDYANCLQAVTGQTSCSPTMVGASGVTSRGDGSLDLPGCDLDGDGLAEESRLHAVKEALTPLIQNQAGSEMSLWRFRQITGGQTCTGDVQCPDTPGGLSLMTCEDIDGNAATSRVCAFDADLLDSVTTAGFEGQCARATFTGSPATFSCSACDSTVTYDRAVCEMFALDRSRTGATSPLDGTSPVTCLPVGNPAHRFQHDHGGIPTLGGCDPTGAERLVNFPATGFDQNLWQLLAWVDHAQSPFSIEYELRAHGTRPLAAALRDLRATTLATATADTESACRRYAAITIVSGPEECETLGDAIAAAASFQDMSFTNGSGVLVPDFDVPVYVVGLGLCPPGSPSCPVRTDLDQIAFAGGTGIAHSVADRAELTQLLPTLVAAAVPLEICNGLDDDCDGVPDDAVACMPFIDGFETGSASSWHGWSP